MARKGLNVISTYTDEAQHDVLKQAAKAENRSLSNYLLTAGLERAERQHDLTPGEHSEE